MRLVLTSFLIPKLVNQDKRATMAGAALGLEGFSLASKFPPFLAGVSKVAASTVVRALWEGSRKTVEVLNLKLAEDLDFNLS